MSTRCGTTSLLLEPLVLLCQSASPHNHCRITPRSTISTTHFPALVARLPTRRKFSSPRCTWTPGWRMTTAKDLQKHAKPVLMSTRPIQSRCTRPFASSGGTFPPARTTSCISQRTGTTASRWDCSLL